MTKTQATIEQALKKAPRSFALHSMLAGLAWARNDATALEKEIELTRDAGPEGEFGALRMRLAIAECHGQLKQARQLTAKADAMAMQARLTETAASGHSQLATWEAVFGFRTQSLELVNQTLKDSQSQGVVTNAAFVLAFLGDNDRSVKLMKDLGAQRPYDTIVQYVDIPTLNAMVEINKKQPARAIDLPGRAPWSMARTNSGVLYTRGMAYLQAKQGKEAADAFQKIFDIRAVDPMDPLASIAQLGMARAYALQGDMPN